MNTPTHKTCTRCHESKPLDEFYKHKGAKDGLRSACKDCIRARNRAWREANREQVRKSNRAWKEANREQVRKSNRAWKEANREQVLKSNRAWREANREQVRESNRAWKEANRERHRENSRAWKAANRERHRETARAWRAVNRERHRENARAWKAANRERHREASRAWQAANRDRGRAANHRRRARKACGVPQRWQIHDIIPFACYWCGTNLRAYGATSHVDHVMPIALGGPADSSNEVMTCSACNQSKSSKPPLVWLAELVSDTWTEQPDPAPNATTAANTTTNANARGAAGATTRLDSNPPHPHMNPPTYIPAIFNTPRPVTRGEGS